MIKVKPGRKFRPDVRLKKLVGGATGITAAQALKAADRRLNGIKQEKLAAIDGKIDGLVNLAWSADPDRWAAIYRGANEVFALAGAFGLDDLSETAYSLCCLIARDDRPATFEATAIVHLEAMRALRRAADSDADRSTRDEILAGLRNLVAQGIAGKGPAPTARAG